MSKEEDPDYLTVYLYVAQLAKSDMKILKDENARLKEENEKYRRCFQGERDWVLMEPSEHARLKAQVERLRNLGIKLESMIDPLEKRIERLTKAGDATLEYLLDYVKPTDGYLTYLDCRANWNTAKEGKDQP